MITEAETGMLIFYYFIWVRSADLIVRNMRSVMEVIGA